MAKNIKVKQDSIKMSISTAYGLQHLIRRLNVNTYGDFEVIQDLNEKLNLAQRKAAELNLAFRKENKVDEKEEINQTHPLFQALNNYVFEKNIDLTKKDTATFSKEEFAQKIQNRGFIFDEIDILKYWLVKD